MIKVTEASEDEENELELVSYVTVFNLDIEIDSLPQLIEMLKLAGMHGEITSVIVDRIKNQVRVGTKKWE